MKNFNDFKREETFSSDALKGGDVMEMLSELSSAYEGKSSDAIMRDILREAERSRKNGTLSDADIDAFVSAISPMLDGKQKKTLEHVVGKLKKS